MTKIAIIGGGIAGCTTALELAKAGHEVVILEEKSDILQGTSGSTPGRIGLGYHYFDLETAKRYRRQTIPFMKKYSQCFLGDETTPYLSNGRYFIVKDSLIELQDLMSVYDELALDYENFCKEDATNNIFGSMISHKALRKVDFKNDVSIEKVALAIETKERLLDWQKFNATLRAELAEFPKIQIITNHKVTNVENNENGQFCLQNQGSATQDVYDCVVNCSWQNIELLNSKLGIGDAHFKKEDPKQAITARLKLLAEVELPESLKDKHSMFFCVGPHAMFSNLGGGIGRLTYAPVTNFGTTTDKEMPELWERWLSGGLNEEETQKYGAEIIVGVAKYIPAMKDAKIKLIIPGIAKSKGSVDINDKDSDFHKRDYSGVEEQQIGWIDNASMKLFYCLGNAREVAEVVQKQEDGKENLKEIIDFVTATDSLESTAEQELGRRIFSQFFTNHLQRNFKVEELGAVNKDGLKEVVVAKSIMLREVKQLNPEGRSNQH